jgi:hypothetical protein
VTIVGRQTLECIETRWLCPAEWTESPPMVPGFRRESIRIEEAEGGMLLVTTLDIQRVISYAESP